jgi:hypothetical protein
MDGINGVSTSYSSFVPSYRREKIIYLQIVICIASAPPVVSTASEICDSLNLCAAHKNCAQMRNVNRRETMARVMHDICAFAQIYGGSPRNPGTARGFPYPIPDNPDVSHPIRCWHVDCSYPWLVNEDCGPPDC